MDIYFLWTESRKKAFQARFELLNGAYLCKTHHHDAKVFHLVPVLSCILNGGECILLYCFLEFSSGSIAQSLPSIYGSFMLILSSARH